MRLLTIDDIQNLHEYELSRPEFRGRVIETKQRRRVPLGTLMTLVFENRDTVRFQVQEMLRVERIVQPDKVQHEIDTYNVLLPGPGEIAATLFIEITDQSRIQTVLDGFIGLDEPGRLQMTIGPLAYPALFAPGQSREDRIAAVHYIRFAPGEAGRAALASGATAAVEVSQGDYRARQELSRDTVRELLADLDAPR
ncbi:MAG TPA: DUF3501 family protein [Thermoanaerobaculia bacterium]|jgi:hypothetical protein